MYDRDHSCWRETIELACGVTLEVDFDIYYDHGDNLTPQLWHIWIHGVMADLDLFSPAVLNEVEQKLFDYCDNNQGSIESMLDARRLGAQMNRMEDR